MNKISSEEVVLNINGVNIKPNLVDEISWNMNSPEWVWDEYFKLCYGAVGIFYGEDVLDLKDKSVSKIKRNKD